MPLAAPRSSGASPRLAAKIAHRECSRTSRTFGVTMLPGLLRAARFPGISGRSPRIRMCGCPCLSGVDEWNVPLLELSAVLGALQQFRDADEESADRR